MIELKRSGLQQMVKRLIDWSPVAFKKGVFLVTGGEVSRYGECWILANTGGRHFQVI